MKYDFETIIDRDPAIRGTGKYRIMKDSKGNKPPKGIVPLSVADMEFRTAPCVIDAIKAEADFGVLGYHRLTDSFRESCCQWMKTRHDWDVQPDWIVPFEQVVPALYNAVWTFTQPGDGILIQTPDYHHFTGATVNTGRKVLENRLVADEIHHDLIQPGYKHIVYASLGKEFADNCVICTSLSKTFNLAGLCYASIIIPNDEVRAKFQKQMGLQAFMHIERFGPVAHEAAYRHGAGWLEELIQVIKGNYEYVRDFFAQHFPGVVVTELEGTYLVWCDFRCFGMSDADMKVFLTDECMLYLDNGTDFGAAGSGYQRINVACPRKTLADALDRFYQAARKRGMAR